MLFKCPNGHEIDCKEDEIPKCTQCHLVATQYNRRTGDVQIWIDATEYRRSCEALQEAIDDAFNNQYFRGDDY